MPNGGLTYATLGDEFAVNSTYARSQNQSDVSKLANGNFVVTWVDAQIGTTADRYIRSQMFAPDGTPIGPETTVSTISGSIQPTVTGLANGGYVVVWLGSGIQAQLFDADGLAVGAPLTVETYSASVNGLQLPDVTALADGGFAVSWHDNRSAGGDTAGSSVHVRAYDQSGAATGAQVLVNTTTAGSQADTSITGLAGGGYVVTWTDFGASWTTRAQIFDASGARVGAEAVISGPGNAVESSVVALSNGNFAVAWYASSQHHIQIFSPTGVPVGGQVDVATALYNPMPAVGPEIAALADGGLAIAFTTNSAPFGDGSGTSVFVQTIGADGQAIGGPVRVNSQTNGNQYDPSIVGLDDGSFVVTWTDLNGAGGDDDQVMAQLFAPRWAVAITSGGGEEAVALALAENGVAVTTVAADNSGGAAIAYQITGGADATLFAIDSETGVLSFLAAPDFELPGDADGDNVYDVVVSASDGVTSDSQAIAVTVGNANEGLAFVSGGGAETFALAIEENESAVAVVLAADIDGDTPFYGIVGGADAALFEVDALTGELRFVGAPDFEAPADADGDNVYEVIVGASDGSFSDQQAISVTVTDSTAGLSFAAPQRTIALDENLLAAGVIAAINEGSAPVSYSIAGGADAAWFAIDAQTGALSLVAGADHEAPADADGDNVYDVVVTASDGSSQVSQAVSVAIGNVDEGVTIVSNDGAELVETAIAENGVAVATLAAVDEDGDPVTFAIVGGADAALFAIDEQTGALRFVGAPDFEAPADADGDGRYKVDVAVISGSFADTQSFAITVADVNEALAITSGGGGATASFTIAENGRNVATITAVDPEGGPAIYSIVGGADAARFTINAQTGLLQFVGTPDYEDPEDADGNNLYNVIVQASDGVFADTQTLTVRVADVNGRSINGTSGADMISLSAGSAMLRATNEEDTIYGQAGNDIIQAGGGNDWILGGQGLDKLTGGAGADEFVYNSAAESIGASRDIILDFSHAQGDRILLSAIDANSAASGNQAFAFIGSAAFTGTAGQLRYEISGGNTLVSGDVNGDGTADFQIQLTGSVALVGADFVL